MAFGQASGPPAPARQLDELAALLERAGFTSFREARHPFGLTQRQAGGKFTADEAAELIERLQAAETVQQVDPQEPLGVPAPQPATQRVPRPPRVRSAASIEAERRREERRAQQLAELGDEVIVAELERRGWCCIAPLAPETT